MRKKGSLEPSLQKAREYAFLLLKYRQRSEKELWQRLKRRNIGDETANSVISFLKEKGFLNDDAFAKSWIASRLAKPLGIRKIREELRAKGVDKQVIENNLRLCTQGYSEEGAIAEIIKNRLTRLKYIEPQKARQRVYSYLARRGFSPEAISEALDQLNNY